MFLTFHFFCLKCAVLIMYSTVGFFLFLLGVSSEPSGLETLFVFSQCSVDSNEPALFAGLFTQWTRNLSVNRLIIHLNVQNIKIELDPFLFSF